MRVCVCARNFHTHTNTHTQLVPPSRARRPVCVYFTITIYNTSRKFCAAAPRTAAKKRQYMGTEKMASTAIGGCGFAPLACAYPPPCLCMCPQLCIIVCSYYTLSCSRPCGTARLSLKSRTPMRGRRAAQRQPSVGCLHNVNTRSMRSIRILYFPPPSAAAVAAVAAAHAPT